MGVSGVENKLNHHCTGIYTLCFLKHQDRYLLIKRANEPNAGLFNGLGGKVSRLESPEENIRREFMEESGLILEKFHLAGILRMVEGDHGNDYLIFTYLACDFSGELLEQSPEGELHWINANQLDSIPMIPNINVFLPLLEASTTPMEMHFLYPDDHSGFTFRYKSGQNWIEKKI